MKKAIIVADLDLLRPLQHEKIPSVVLAYDKNSPVLYSRHCRDWRYMPPPYRDPQKALEVLLEVSQECDEKPVLFYAEDSLLNLLQRNRNTLRHHYHFLMPADRIAQSCNDKSKFAKLANDYKLPVPKQWSSREVDEGRDINELAFPLVIKPDTHIGWKKSSVIKAAGGRPSKIVLARNREEADVLLPLTREFCQNFVIQEFIPGAENQIYSYHAFANECFEPLGWYVGHKLRCYPSFGGESSLIELVHDTQVAKLGLEILKKLQICGPVKIDFKKDPRTGKIYLLEINLRFNLWHHLGASCGVNLPAISYRHFSGEIVRPSLEYNTSLRWINFERDIRAMIGDYLPSGAYSLKAYIRSLFLPKIYHLFAWNDPIPAIVSSFQKLRRQFSKPFA